MMQKGSFHQLHTPRFPCPCIAQAILNRPLIGGEGPFRRCSAECHSVLLRFALR